MTEMRILCRVITYDPATCSILLVRNRNQKWWYAPGGAWDYTLESILECAKREVFEETGVHVNITRFLYVQTLYIEKQDSTWLEQFWLAEPAGNTEIPQRHIDRFGVVDKVSWFTQAKVQTITVYPEIIKKSFWNVVAKIIQEEDRYLGHFIL